MSILFAASEIGSARALMPLCNRCFELGDKFSVVPLGNMAELIPAGWEKITGLPDDIAGISAALVEQGVDVLVFSVNVKDEWPLKIARAAKKAGIPTIHVLDYWSNYLKRMQLDNDVVFMPDVYVVPDDYARRQAIREGVSSDCIQVLGQPALADTVLQYEANASRSMGEILGEHFVPGEKNVFLFVSETVQMDQGRSLDENPGFRGYTEQDAMRILVDALGLMEAKARVIVLPHPREDINALAEFWHDIGGCKYGEVLRARQGRDFLPYATAVIGMSSTLLYESWLLGVPVASVQPNLRVDSLRMMSEREGVCFITEQGSAVQQLSKWLGAVTGTSTERKYRSEVKIHQSSVDNIYQLIGRCRVKGLRQYAVSQE